MTRHTAPARLIAAAILLASTSLASAAGWGANYKAAVAESKKTGKPILADFTGSDWCGWCIKLDKEVFSTADFKKWAADNVVLLTVDFPQRTKLPPAIAKQNQELQQKYGVQGFPTVLLLDADGEVLGKTGYQEGGPANWIAGVDAIVQASKPVPVKIESDAAAAVVSAKQSGKALLLLIDAGETEALDKRAEVVLNDPAVRDLAHKMIVARVRRAGADATPAVDLASIESMLEAMKIEKTPSRVVAVDLTGDEPKSLFDAPSLPTPAILAARLEKSLPKPTYAGGWIENYADALALAKDTKRNVLLDFTGSDWCGWCIKLDKEVFSTDAFKAYADANLILVKLDYPRRTPQSAEIKAQNTKLAAQYGIQGYPTIIVLNPKGQRIADLGYMPGGPEAFIAELKKLK